MSGSMHRSAVFVLLLGCALVLLGAAGCRDDRASTGQPAAGGNSTAASALIMPDHGAYTGAYVDFGEGEAEVSYDALVHFERMTGKRLAVVAFGNFWGDQQFPARTARIVSSYGAIPLLFWSPWDKPYTEGRGRDRFSLQDILAGKWDAYIDAWAKDARDYGRPLLVAWGLEMNGTWFPWSGYYYGRGKVIARGHGVPLYQGPDTFKRAYRHVVDRVRKQGVTNVLWGFHANNFSSPSEAWNDMANYYPGSDYVDWLGLSVYGKINKAEGWADFVEMMDQPYREITRLDADKPVFLAEWGVGEFPPGDKAGFITTVFDRVPVHYPRVRLAVFWHERWENSDGIYSNLRVNSSPEALAAYRKGVAAPYWIDRPLFAPKTGTP